MKQIIFLVLLSSLSLTACSHAPRSNRTPSSTRDVGVLGPDGQVNIYYQEGENIIVRKCPPLTILGASVTEARQKCQAGEVKISVSKFRQAIRDSLAVDQLSRLKPLIVAEAKTYVEKNFSKADVAALEAEFKRIDDFIKAYGDQKSLGKLASDYKTLDEKLKVIREIEKQIDATITLIADQSKIEVKKLGPDGDQFIYTVLLKFIDEHLDICGQEGSIEQKKASCKELGQKYPKLELITKDDKGLKFLDPVAKVFWAVSYSSDLMNFYEAEKACKAIDPESSSGIYWRLPTLKEFADAEDAGLGKILSSAASPAFGYWSSDIAEQNTYFAYYHTPNTKNAVLKRVNHTSKAQGVNNVACAAHYND